MNRLVRHLYPGRLMPDPLGLSLGVLLLVFSALLALRDDASALTPLPGMLLGLHTTFCSLWPASHGVKASSRGGVIISLVFITQAIWSNLP